jgi:hypothetical protein
MKRSYASEIPLARGSTLSLEFSHRKELFAIGGVSILLDAMRVKDLEAVNCFHSLLRYSFSAYFVFE